MSPTPTEFSGRWPSHVDDPSRRLLLVGGRRGVGATTVVAGAPMTSPRAISEDPPRLLPSDPANRAGDAFAGGATTPSLVIEEFDAEAVHRALIHRYGSKLAAIAERGNRLNHHDVRGLLDPSMPGMHELMSVLAVAQITADPSGRRLMTENASSARILQRLSMPETLDRWIDVLDALLEEHQVRLSALEQGAAPDEIEAVVASRGDGVRTLAAMLRDPERGLVVPEALVDTTSIAGTDDQATLLAGSPLAVPRIVFGRTVSPDVGGTPPRRTKRAPAAKTADSAPAIAAEPAATLSRDDAGNGAFSGREGDATSLPRWLTEQGTSSDGPCTVLSSDLTSPVDSEWTDADAGVASQVRRRTGDAMAAWASAPTEDAPATEATPSAPSFDPPAPSFDAPAPRAPTPAGGSSPSALPSSIHAANKPAPSFAPPSFGPTDAPVAPWTPPVLASPVPCASDSPQAVDMRFTPPESPTPPPASASYPRTTPAPPATTMGSFDLEAPGAPPTTDSPATPCRATPIAPAPGPDDGPSTAGERFAWLPGAA